MPNLRQRPKWGRLDESTHTAVRWLICVISSSPYSPFPFLRNQLGQLGPSQETSPGMAHSVPGTFATVSVLSGWLSLALECKLLNNRDPRQCSLVVKGSESGAQTAWTWLRPAPTLTSWVTLGKFLNVFIPQFSHL